MAISVTKVIRDARRFVCNVPVIFARFYPNLNFRKSVYREPSSCVRTHALDEANTRFSELCESARKDLEGKRCELDFAGL